MKAVYKYDIPVEGSVGIPKGAEILSIEFQHGIVRIWALVDTTVDLESRTFVIYGTGHEVNEALSLRFLSTTITKCGSLVFHVFEVL